MDITKKLNEVQKFINDTRNEHLKRIEMMESLIEKAKADKAKAEHDSKAAFDAMNVTDYQKYQKAIILASDELAMYEAKLAEMRSMPLMSKDQYDQFVNDINTGLDEMYAAEAAKLAKVINDLFIPAADSTTNAISKAHNMLEAMATEFLKYEIGTANYANATYSLRSRENSIASLVHYMMNSKIYRYGGTVND